MQNLLARERPGDPAYLDPERLRDPRRPAERERDRLLDREAAGEPEPSRERPFLRASTGERERVASLDLDLSCDLDFDLDRSRDADLPRDPERNRDLSADLDLDLEREPSRDFERDRPFFPFDLLLDRDLDLVPERERPSSVILKWRKGRG